MTKKVSLKKFQKGGDNSSIQNLKPNEFIYSIYGKNQIGEIINKENLPLGYYILSQTEPGIDQIRQRVIKFKRNDKKTTTPPENKINLAENEYIWRTQEGDYKIGTIFNNKYQYSSNLLPDEEIIRINDRPLIINTSEQPQMRPRIGGKQPTKTKSKKISTKNKKKN